MRSELPIGTKLWPAGVRLQLNDSPNRVGAAKSHRAIVALLAKVTETRLGVTNTRTFVTEMPSSVTLMAINVTDDRINVTDQGICVTDDAICVTDNRISVTVDGICVTANGIIRDASGGYRDVKPGKRDCRSMRDAPISMKTMARPRSQYPTQTPAQRQRKCRAISSGASTTTVSSFRPRRS